MIPLNNKNYSVGENGEIYSKRRDIFMKPQKLKNGYLFVRIDKKTQLIHRLVATAYIPNINDLPCVNHKDKNKENNHISNLEWCTYSENNHHRNDKMNPQDRFNQYINNGVSLEVALYSLC
jgi:hypothetical protein